MTSRAFYGALFLAFALAACGGGGGGGTTPQPNPTATATPTPAPSVQGDMLALAPSRGWNYQATYNGQNFTLSLYADPTPTNGVHAVVAAGEFGFVPTMLTSASNVDSNLVGAVGFTVASDAYTAVSELSAGSTAAIPGNPLFVPATLTQGQTWTPATGASATVTLVGSVPNANICPTPAMGASVRYTYPGFDETISFVPGCGITNVLNNSNGADFKLISVNTYASLGELSEGHRIGSLSILDTARSLIGLGRNVAPGSHAVAPLFAHR